METIAEFSGPALATAQPEAGLELTMTSSAVRATSSPSTTSATVPAAFSARATSVAG